MSTFLLTLQIYLYEGRKVGTFLMTENKYGTEKQGNVIAVVDYSKTVKLFSKVLTKKEQEAFDTTGYLPDGVSVKEVFQVVETFPTVQEANSFIAAGAKKKIDHSYGVFKSRAQYKLARQLVA